MVFFDYAKIRILPKTDLYDDTCPVLNWFDFWDLRDPANPTFEVATVRPAVTFGTPSVYYLINDAPFLTGNHMTVWQIADPVGTPVLSGANVPTTTRMVPPDAGQLNPPPTPIDVGGPRIRNVFYRNNRLWTAHSVADGTGVFARARYVRFDVSGAPVADQDISFGADGCWLYYPAVAADQNDNLVMVYTQSCTNEYASVYFTGRTTTEPTLQPGQVLQAGVAKYELLDGGGRNRWGDYSGIAVDPADQNRIWVHGEFATTPTGIDQWQTWVGEIISRGVGDVNDDGQVNVADLTLLTEYVLEITPAPTPPSLDFTVSDCASDGVLNIGDIVCVVDLILNPSGPALAAGAVPIGAINPSRVRLNLAEADAARAVGESRAYTLDADIGPGIAAFQMRIAYDPTRVRIGTPRAVESASAFTVASNDTGDELIIIGYSMDGRLLDPGEGPIVSLPVDELRPSGPGDEPALELTEVMFSDRAGGVAYASVGQATLAKPLPLVLKLGEPYPNPVGLQGTRIDLEIPVGIAPNLSGAGAASGGGTIRVLAEVYNVRGQLVRRVLDEPMPPGRHAIEWDGRSENGAAVSAGLYVMRVIAGTLNETRKLIVSSRSRD